VNIRAIYPLPQRSRPRKTRTMKHFIIAVLILFQFCGVGLAQNSVLATGQWYKMAVTEDGVYRLDPAQLAQWGIDATDIDPRTIRIFGNGGGLLPEENSSFRPTDLVENAITVTGEADGSFDIQDRVLFYGLSPHRWVPAPDGSCGPVRHQKHLYSDTTFYFLNFGLQNGLRMATRSSVSIPTQMVVTAFEDSRYVESDSVNLLHSGRNWFGERFDPSVTTRSFSFHFPYRKSNMPVTVRTEMAASCLGCTTTVAISANGTFISSMSILPTQGYSVAAKEATACDTFTTNSNTVNIGLAWNASDSYAMAWLNSLEVTAHRKLVQSGAQMHWAVTDTAPGLVSEARVAGAADVSRVWDITDPLHPIRQDFDLADDTLRFRFHSDSAKRFVSFLGTGLLSPHTINAVPNQNLHAIGPKNLIIITPKEFVTEANRLAQHHQTHDGLTTAVVRLERIYNEFSSGAKDISAIRDFIRQLYNRPSGPAEMRYILLFGDGSFDPKNRIPQNRDLIPTYQSSGSLLLTTTNTTDDFYCWLDSAEGGATGSPLIDLAIGRMPANTLDEARIMVDKIIHYTTSPATYGPWRSNASFVAEDGDQDLWAQHMDYFAQYLDTAHCFPVGQKIFLGAFDQPLVNGAETCPIAHDSLVSAFDDNLILGINVMGKDLWLTNERILDSVDVVNLSTLNALPFVIMPHNDGIPMDDPNRNVLSEWLVRDPDGGAIACYAPSRISYLAPNFTATKEFYLHAYEKENGAYPRIGDLIFRMKTINPGNNERSKTLLGDPALRLNYPKNEVVITLPGTPVNAEGNYELIPNMAVQVDCEVFDANGNPLSGFNGTATLMLEAKRNEETQLTAVDFGYDFEQYHHVSRAISPVVDGQCSFGLTLPDTFDITTNSRGRLRVYVQSADTDGLGSSCQIAFTDFFDAVNETASTHAMSLWPNPTPGPVHILLPGGSCGNIHVHDMFGRVVHRSTYSPGTPIDLSGVAAGVYQVVSHQDTGVRSVRKVVVSP
jgi:hypothetical protein